MALRLLTLDCANTLLRGAWDPVGFALWAARDAGLCLPARAAADYGALLKSHYPALLAANRTGDEAIVQAEYVCLGEAWLRGLDVDPVLSGEVVAASERLLVSTELFQPFEDTVPFLTAARARGLRLAVVSNWDVSLPRVLAAHGLDLLVDDVFASLVVGAEKPDPAMLQLAMARAGASTDETLHIGDDPVDDLGAAANAGVRAILVDGRSISRARTQDARPVAVSRLMEVLEWID